MITKELQEAIELATKLPPDEQTRIAKLITESVARDTPQTPNLPSELEADYQAVRQQLAATIDYLKDK